MSPRDDAKRKILERRASFLAAALASAGLASGAVACRSEKPPQTCLEPPVEPQVCLSPLAPDPEPDAGEPQICLSVAPDPGPDGGGPQVCLEVDPEPRPQVCLSEPAPGDGPFAKPPPDEG